MKAKLVAVVLILLLGWGAGSLYADRFIPKSDLIPAVLSTVSRSYVDSNRLLPKVMLEGSLERLSNSIAPVLTQLQAEKGKLNVTVSVDQYKREFVFAEPKDAMGLNPILQEVATFTKSHLERSEKPEEVDYALINGFLRKLDPHSMLLVPEVYSDFNQSTVGNYTGVGMMIGVREGQLTVISPIDDSPAAKAGIRAKDKIMQIDDESTVNLGLEDAVSKLKGPEGTTVGIYILREGFSAPKRFDVKRAQITISSVEQHRFERDKKTVGYIKLKTFGKNTIEELDEALKELDYDFKSFQGLVLDLRNNPGGLLAGAISVSDRFLERGVIVSTAGLEEGSDRSFEAHWWNTIKDVPVIILVNSGSASASEIVTAALKSHDRAVVLGNRTFGKGSVQQVIPMNDGSALKLTMSKYLTPGERSIQSVGVAPHIELVPYQISTDYLRLSPPKNEGVERELDQNFKEWADKPENPERKTFFLFDETADAGPGEEEDLDMSPKEERLKAMEKDYLLTSAVDILFENKRRGYEKLFETKSGQRELLKTAHGYFQKAELKQEEKIIAKFKELKVDWTKLPARGKAKLQARHWVEVKTGEAWKQHEGPLGPEMEFRLHLEVKNLGPDQVSRLLATTTSDNELLDDRQFAYGLLKAGETKDWYIPFKLSSNLISRNDQVEVSFTDATQNSLATDRFDLTLAEAVTPEFQYRLSPPQNITTGKVSLPVTVTNLGKGTSGKLSLLLKNGEGKRIFLNKGRLSLAELKPGQSHEAAFEFDLKELPLDGDLDLSLDVIDGTYSLVSLNQKLKIALKGATVVDNAAPSIRLQQVPLVANGNRITLQGELVDQGGVKDLIVLLNDKKVFYKNYLREAQRNQVALSLDLDLGKEVNRIILISRDDHNVDAKKAIFVRKAKP